MHLDWDFLNSHLEIGLVKKNQDNPNTTQICFETYNSFQVLCDINLNWGFLKFQLGIQFEGKDLK